MIARHPQLAAAIRRLAGGAAAAVLFVGPAAGQVLLLSPRYGAPPQPTSLTVGVFAVTQPTVAFLDRSSRLALDRAGARRLRRFAQVEAREQAQAAATLVVLAGATPVGSDPLDVVAVGAASLDEASEAVLSRLPPLLRTPGARAVAADQAIAQAARDDLARLAALDGDAFDAVYVATQTEGLRRLVDVYRDYVQNGDEQALRAFAVHELPRVRARLTEIDRR